MLIAEDIQVEWDEGGCYLLVDGERWRVADPEALFDRVKAAILPWLMQRDEALREYRAGMALAADVLADARDAYPIDSPKHPDFHSVHADIWGAREGK